MSDTATEATIIMLEKTVKELPMKKLEILRNKTIPDAFRAGYLRALEEVRAMLAKDYEFQDGCIDTYADGIYAAIDKLKSEAGE